MGSDILAIRGKNAKKPFLAAAEQNIRAGKEHRAGAGKIEVGSVQAFDVGRGIALDDLQIRAEFQNGIVQFSGPERIGPSGVASIDIDVGSIGSQAVSRLPDTDTVIVGRIGQGIKNGWRISKIPGIEGKDQAMVGFGSFVIEGSISHIDAAIQEQ